jgi:hypothetical protein
MLFMDSGETRAMTNLKRELPNWRGIGGRTPRVSASRRGVDKLLAIEDKLFTAPHLRFYGAGIVAALLLGCLLSWVANQADWVIRSDGTLSSTDFCWIWVASKFAASSDPSGLFDHAMLEAAHNTYYAPGECFYIPQFVYLPNFLFLIYPLGFMPYLTAFSVWIIGTLLLYLVTVYLITPRPATVIIALTSAAALKNIQHGHAGFVVAALIGLSLVSIERRPWLSGLFLGLLTCKPQYGALFPAALLVSRNWRVIVSAAATTIVLGVAAGVAFGFQGWPAFIDSLFDRNAGLSPDGRVELALQSVYRLVTWLGGTAGVSWTIHLIVAAALILAIAAIWAKPRPHSLKAAALCIAAVMFTPYVLAWDLCIVSVAAAFFVRDGLSRGFLPGERIVMLLCWAGLFSPVTPIAPLICTALFLLVVRRIVAGGKLDRAREPGPGDFLAMKPVPVD